jgi:hypothetical protein
MRSTTGSGPSGAPPAPHLQLTASVETVQGLQGAPEGDLEFAGVVPAATVQRLACDASIRRVLLGPDAAVIEVRRALRVPSGRDGPHSGCMTRVASGRAAIAPRPGPTPITSCTRVRWDTNLGWRGA